MSLARQLRPVGGRAAAGPTQTSTSPLVLVAVVALALIVGVLAVRSLQAAATLTILILLLAVYAQSRRVGLVALWAVWLLTPALRRLLALSGGTPVADPLSLLPFLATGVLALSELRRSAMGPAARSTMAIAGFGFLIGAPMGLLADPAAFGYSLLAYLAGLGAFAIGWGDARSPGVPTLVKVLVVAAPAIAAYGIGQYFLPLTAWDANWVEAVDLASIGSPQDNHIRVYSTLNSPGTLGLVLAVALLLGLGLQRRPLTALAANLTVLVALALTFVRSAWLALATGVLVFLAGARGRSAGRLLVFISVFLVGIFVLGGSNPTTRAFTERITTLGQLNEDESANARFSAANEFFPVAISHPLGEGLGQAGLSVRLGEGGDSESMEATDNGYLALVYELGPLGFLLVTFAMARGTLAGLRALGPSRGAARQARAAVLAVLAALLLANAGGDILYGITGAIFWYLAGLSMATEEDVAERASVRVDESTV